MIAGYNILWDVQKPLIPSLYKLIPPFMPFLLLFSITLSEAWVQLLLPFPQRGFYRIPDPPCASTQESSNQTIRSARQLNFEVRSTQRPDEFCFDGFPGEPPRNSHLVNQ